MKTSEPKRATKNILVISPHPDDAALSIGGWLLEQQGRTTVLTLFGWSGNAPNTPFHGCRLAASVIRYREDRRFAKEVSAKLRYTMLSDTRADVWQTVQWRQSPQSPEPSRRHAHNAIRKALAASEAENVIVPAGIGNHVDHLVARDLTMAALSPGTHLWFYEDLWYAAEYSLEEIDSYIMALADHITPRVRTGNIEEKIRLLKVCYPSQFTTSDLNAVRLHWQRVNGERIWETD